MSGFGGSISTPINNNSKNEVRGILDVYTKDQVDTAIQQSTATKDIGSLFTNRDSHVSRLNARQSGKIVTLSCTITAGVANNTKLFDIDSSIEPSFGDWVAPLVKSSGELVDYGTAWIYRSTNLQANYYGSQATNAELTFDLYYLAK